MENVVDGQGLKLIPAGFHLISFVPAPHPPSSDLKKSSGSNQALPSPLEPSTHIGQQIKRGLIHFFKPQEIVIRSYDPEEESLHQASPHQAESLICSGQYMKSLDSNLAPYPIERYSTWKTLTSHIRSSLVDQVLGLNSSGDAILDSLMCNEETSGLSGHSRQQSWSNSQAQRDHSRFEDRALVNKPRSDGSMSHPQQYTRWPILDLKRSWPKDCVGEELTKWSRDKSWLFHEFITSYCQRGQSSLLTSIHPLLQSFHHQVCLL